MASKSAYIHAYTLHAINSAQRLGTNDNAADFTSRVAQHVGRTVQRHVAVRNASLPNFFFNISAFAGDIVKDSSGNSFRANNVLSFRKTNGDLFTVTITEGHYAFTLGSPLLVALNTMFEGGSLAAVGAQEVLLTVTEGTSPFSADATAHLTVVDESQCLKAQWVSTTGVTLVNNRLARNLGFYLNSTDPEITIASASPALGTRLLAPRPINLPSLETVLITMDELDSSNFYAIAPDRVSTDSHLVRDLHMNTVAAIPMTAGYGEWCVYYPQELDWIYMGKSNAMHRIRLFDQTGNPLRMPVDWGMTLIYEAADSRREHDTN